VNIWVSLKQIARITRLAIPYHILHNEYSFHSEPKHCNTTLLSVLFPISLSTLPIATHFCSTLQCLSWRKWAPTYQAVMWHFHLTSISHERAEQVSYHNNELDTVYQICQSLAEQYRVLFSFTAIEGHMSLAIQVIWEGNKHLTKIMNLIFYLLFLNMTICPFGPITIQICRWKTDWFKECYCTHLSAVHVTYTCVFLSNFIFVPRYSGQLSLYLLLMIYDNSCAKITYAYTTWFVVSDFPLFDGQARGKPCFLPSIYYLSTHVLIGR
jgi:hypothetical protein